MGPRLDRLHASVFRPGYEHPRVILGRTVLCMASAAFALMFGGFLGLLSTEMARRGWGRTGVLVLAGALPLVLGAVGERVAGGEPDTGEVMVEGTAAPQEDFFRFELWFTSAAVSVAVAAVVVPRQVTRRDAPDETRPTDPEQGR